MFVIVTVGVEFQLHLLFAASRSFLYLISAFYKNMVRLGVLSKKKCITIAIPDIIGPLSVLWYTSSSGQTLCDLITRMMEHETRK